MATSNGVRFNRKNLDRLLKRLAIMERKEIRWGFFGAKYGPDNDNMYVATIARIQQEGRPKSKGLNFIPPRRFFYENIARVSSNLDTHGVRLEYLIRNAVASTMHGQTDAAAFEKIGKHLQTTLKDEIIAFNTPPNAPYTIKLKGKDDPLIDTGFMLKSVEYRTTLARKTEVTT